MSKAEPNPARVAEKLCCYRLKTYPELCTAPDCEYNNRDPVIGYYCCYNQLLHDAEELLKAKEPVKPKRIDGKHNHFIKCGNCNMDLMSGMKFCPHCGREVGWNEQAGSY